MKKITMALIVGMVLISLITAQVVISNIKPVVLPTMTPTAQIEQGNITFNCGKTLISVKSQEPDGILDENDVESLIRSICPTEEVTNIKDWDNRLFKEYDGVKSFNETYLEELKNVAITN